MNAKAQWLKEAARIGRRTWWAGVFDSGRAWLIAGGVALFGTGMAGRIAGWEWTWLSASLAAAAWAVAMAGILALLHRNRYACVASGLARIDTVYKLNSSLSACFAGHGTWPEVPERLDDRFRLNWRTILPSYAILFGLSLAGALIPLPAAAGQGGGVTPPRSHEEIAAEIAALRETGAFEEKALDDLQERLDEITEQPPENWYAHSNLEAADNLQAGLLEQLSSLEKNLGKAASSLEAMQSPSDESPGGKDQQKLASEFKAAVQAIKSASPGLNQKLMDSLSSLDPSALKSLNQSELKSMLEQMKQTTAACKNCSGNGKGAGKGGNSDAESELERLLGDGQGRSRSQMGDSRGKEQEGPGRGGVNRGPGVAPLPLSSSPTDLSTANPESLANPDLSRAGIGDTIGNSDTEHRLDKQPQGLQSAGAARTGDGGDAVSREELLPSEKALLKSFFRSPAADSR